MNNDLTISPLKNNCVTLLLETIKSCTDLLPGCPRPSPCCGRSSAASKSLLCSNIKVFADETFSPLLNANLNFFVARPHRPAWGGGGLLCHFHVFCCRQSSLWKPLLVGGHGSFAHPPSLPQRGPSRHVRCQAGSVIGSTSEISNEVFQLGKVQRQRFS